MSAVKNADGSGFARQSKNVLVILGESDPDLIHYFPTL
jgi:hypothetical protein